MGQLDSIESERITRGSTTTLSRDSSSANGAPYDSALLNFGVALCEPVKKSYNAVKQVTAAVGVHLPEWQMKPANTRCTSGMVGSALGSIAEFYLVNEAVGKVSGIGRLSATSTWKGEALKMGITGATIGFLEPVADGKPFLRSKLVSTLDGGASMAVFGGSSGLQAEFGVLGRPRHRSFIGEAVTNSLSGTASGIVGAEIRSIGMNGEPAALSELKSQIVTNAVLGIGLAGVDRALHGRSRIALNMEDGAVSKPTFRTEEWAAKIYDSKTEIMSPILTWLAEHHPTLRPDSYSELRTRAWAETGAIDLSLSDWSASQRPDVIRALRRLSKSELATDQNLDALVSRFNTPEVNAAYREAVTIHKPAFDYGKQVKAEVAKNPELAPFQYGMVHPDMKPLSPEQEKFCDLVRKRTQAEMDACKATNKDRLDPLLQEQFTKLTTDTGLPALTVSTTYGYNGAQRVGDGLYLGLRENVPQVSARFVELAVHEFEHHRQGLLNASTIGYFLRYPFYSLQQKLGLIDMVPMMQSPRNRVEFIENYVGSSAEVGAYSTGLLARIRAVALDLPAGQ